MINIFFGIVNLLPLLPFDGGHIAVATYEKIASTITGRRVQVDVAKLMPIADGWSWSSSCSSVLVEHLSSTSRTRSRTRSDRGASHRRSRDVVMVRRRKTRQVMVGNVAVGGDAPVSVQSMTTTKTADVDGTLAQIYALAAAGCDIVRCTCNEEAAAEGLAQIVPRSPVPIIADIHFQYKLALAAMEAGVQALRLNPGNIRKPEHIKPSRAEAKDRGLPIRIGVNAGSLDPAMAEQHGGITPEALVASAMHELDLFREVDFDDVKISVKASNVPLMIDAYRLLVGDDRPPAAPRRHRGRARCRRAWSSRVAGIGTLLAEGIGDTIRFSLTADPVEEAQGRAHAARGARAARAQGPRPHRVPVVRPRRGRRDQASRPTRRPRSRRATSRCRSR